MVSEHRTVPGIAGAGLVLLVMGVLAIAAGLGLMVFTQEDQPTNDQGGLDGREPTAADDRQARMGQTIAVGGGAVAFLALVFIVIGRAD